MRKINLKLLLGLGIGLGLLTGALAVAHHLQYRRIPQSLLQQAQKAEEEGSLERTDQFLSRYLEFEPDDLEQRARLAKLLADPNYSKSVAAQRRAYEQLEHVLARDPSRQDLRRLVVPLALKLERLKEAGQHLEQLQKEAPQDGAVASLVGQYHEVNKDPHRAADAYRNAVKYAPTQVDDYLRLARVLRTLRWDNLAGEALNQKRKAADAEADQVMVAVVRNNPGSWQAHVARWVYLRDHYGEELRKKDSPVLAEGVAAIERSLELAEGQPEVRLAAAEAARIQKQWAKSREHLDKALQLHPNDPRVYRGLSNLELMSVADDATDADRAQARTRAYNWLRQGVKETKGYNQFDLMWSFATLLLDHGTAEGLQESEGLIERIAATNVSPAGTDYLRARLLFSRQQWSQAVKLFERARSQMENVVELARPIETYLARCYGLLEDRTQQFDAYRRLAKLDPESVTAVLGMAEAARALGKHAEAMEHFRKASTMNKAPATATVEMVRLMTQQARAQKAGARWQEVEQVLTRYEKDGGDPVEVAVLRAEMLLAQEKPKEAGLALEEAQKQHPQRVELWVARSTLAQQQKNPNEALRLLDEADRAVRGGPGDKPRPADLVDLRLERARFWATRANDPAKKEEAKKALTAVSQGIDTLPPAEQERLLGGLAACHYRAGQREEAANLWADLATRESYRSDLRLRLVLFDVALELGDRARMDQVLNEVKQIENGEGTFTKHAQALRQIWLARQGGLQGKEREAALDTARDLLNQVEAARPGWPAVVLARGEVEELKGDYDQAVAQYRKALTTGQRNPQAVRQLVAALRRIPGREREANDELRRLSQDELASTGLVRLAADLSLRTNDPDRAARLAMDTVKADSRDWRDHLWLGEVLAASGQRASEAEQSLQKAINLAPAESEPWVAMCRFLMRQKREKDAAAVLEQVSQQVAAERRPLTLACCYQALGQADKAAEQFEAAVKAAPGDAKVLREYTQFRLERGEMDKVEPLLRKLLGESKGLTDEDTEWATTRLAVALSVSNDWAKYQEALTLLGLRVEGGKVAQENSKLKTDSLEVRRAQARLLATQPMGQFRDEAVRRFEELSARNGLTTDDRFILARLYESKGAWPKARDQFRQLSLDPQAKLSHLMYYIQGLLRQNELTEADRQLSKLRQAEKARPTSAGTLALIELQARWLEANNQPDKALTLLQDRLRHKDSDPQEVLLLVSALGRQKKFPEAVARLDEVWKACPAETAGGTSVAVLRASRGSETERKSVENRLRQAIDQNPKSAVLLVQLGDLKDLAGDYDEAEKAYRKALDINPRDVMALNNLAWLTALRQRKGEDALALINRAISAAGPRAELLDTRAVIYLTLNRPQEALSDLNEAIAEHGTGTRYFHLARAEHQANNRDAAVRALRQARQMGLQPGQLHPAEQVVYTTLTREFNAE